MAGVLHGGARKTPRVRAELQASKEKTSVLAKRYGLSRTTVAKWRTRTSTGDAPMDPRDPRSTVLTPVEEAIIVEFRRRTLPPLDDVMGCLKDTIPKMTRSSRHCSLARHGVSRGPESEESGSKRGSFAKTPIGYVHIDHCERRLARGKLHMFLAIDRISKFTHVEFRERTKMLNGAAFPYQIHSVLTDNGMAFAVPPKNLQRRLPEMWGPNMFDHICAANGLVHKLTKHYPPWTNGQVERMNRTIKEATTRDFHYPTLDSLQAHVPAFVTAWNFSKHLMALRWKTPFEAICDE